MPEQLWNFGWVPIFIIIAFIFASIATVARIVFPKVDREEERAKSIALARKVASCKQWVREIVVYERTGTLILYIRSDSAEMEEVELNFHYKHLDFRRLSKISKLVRIEFEFQDTPVFEAEKQNATAYLRLK